MSAPRTTPLAGHRGEVIALATLAAGLGALSSLQGHWNAQMADLLHDPREAALLSLGTGLVILSVLVASRADLRSGLGRGVRAYRSGELVWWQLLGGLGGAAFIAGQSIVVPRVGVALFTVAVVGAQTANSLFVDRAGLGPSGHQPITRPRVVAAIVAVLAVVISVWGKSATFALGPLVLALVAGALIAVQYAVNGRVAVATGSAGGRRVGQLRGGLHGFAGAVPDRLAGRRGRGARAPH